MGRNGNLRLLRVAALVGVVAAAVGAQAAGVGLAQAALDLVPQVRSGLAAGEHSVRSGNGSGQGHTPVTLCHATSSETNPYVVITTDDDGVLGAGQSGGNGHDSHSGDIIPMTDGLLRDFRGERFGKYRTVEYVTKEVEALALQAKAAEVQ